MSMEKALGIMRADLDTAFDPVCFAALERTLAAIEGDLARAA
jgi:HD-GYP domain-containing protein (c-di-GMP phosphodiesterase class II)